MQNPIERTSRLLRILSFILAAIGIVMVVRRVLVLGGTLPDRGFPGQPPFDAGFGLHPVLTLIHILPGLLFMITGPLLFLPTIRNGRKTLYHGLLRIFITVSYITGISALLMPFVMQPIGGLNEAAASILYGLVFLFCLTMTWRRSRRHHPARSESARNESARSEYVLSEYVRNREWLIRTFSLGLAVSTTRPIMALFFAFSGQPPQVFFGTAFWIGFTLHFIAAEAWVNYTREDSVRLNPSPSGPPVKQ